MTIHHIIKSAELYYDYLNKNSKGIEKISVNKIVTINHKKIKLYIDKKLFNSENFSLFLSGEIYKSEELKVTDYDAELKAIIISPPEYIYSALVNASTANVYLICDLKFLVKRVIDWYKENSYPIKLLSRNCNIKNDFFIYPPGIDNHQQNAIDTTLTNPVSYVWGAPGTGKTRYVLSYSILAHATVNERVLVVAPTNNALDQTLHGIIATLESYGINQSEIFRLGVPSHRFATAYPECCEVEGLNKKVEELENIIASLKEQKKHAKLYKEYQNLSENILPKITTLTELAEDIHNIQNEIEIRESKINHIDSVSSKIYNAETELAQNIKETESKLSSYNKFSSLLFKSKKEALDAQLSILYHKLNDCIEKQQEHQRYKNTLLDEISELKNKIDLNLVNASITEIKKIHSLVPQNIALIESLSIDNCNSVLTKLFEIELRLKNKIDEFGIGSSTAEELQQQIDNCTLELEAIKENSTEHRLQTAKVIATTIDGFFAKSALANYAQTSSETPIHHIYLDEAGYCSLIKGLALFACDIPITLLGDHMQLPPICEMNDKDFDNADNYLVFLWAQSILAVEDIFKSSLEDAFFRYKQSEAFSFDYIVKADLKTTYRFGKALSEILNSYVYKNGFTSSSSVDELSIKVLHAGKITTGRKRDNIAELNKIKEYLSQHNNIDYVILTPYTDQVKLLNQNLPSARRDQRIMTIHASQGREFDTVILSVVDKSNQWFTDSTKKASKGLQVINTAVSRAKKELIIVCDAEFWASQNNQLIGELVRSTYQNHPDFDN